MLCVDCAVLAEMVGSNFEDPRVSDVVKWFEEMIGLKLRIQGNGEDYGSSFLGAT